MITILPEKEKQSIIRFFKQCDVKYSEISGCVTACDGQEIIGYCLYELDDKKMTILRIEPISDIMLADGILRSTIHIATERSIMNIEYAENAPFELFDKLGFIKDKRERKLNADKLFGDCC